MKTIKMSSQNPDTWSLWNSLKNLTTYFFHIDTNYRYLIFPFSCSIYFSVEFYLKRKMIYVWVDVKVSQLCSSAEYFYSLEKKNLCDVEHGKINNAILYKVVFLPLHECKKRCLMDSAVLHGIHRMFWFLEQINLVKWFAVRNIKII